MKAKVARTTLATCTRRYQALGKGVVLAKIQNSRWECTELAERSGVLIFSSIHLYARLASRRTGVF